RMGRTTARPFPLLACFLVVQGSCAPEATRLSWTITFADPARFDSDDKVLAWIMRGGCNSHEHVLDVELGSDVDMSGTTTLAPGTYGFAAEARDSQCRPLAFGCIERRLPGHTSAPVEIVLQSEDGEAPRCAPELCQAGSCVDEPPDASTLDASAPKDAMSDAKPAADAQTAVDAVASDAALGTDASLDASDGAAGDARVLDGASGDCPEGVRRSGGSCYRFLEQMADYTSARDMCTAWGGAHVVVLADASEEAWITATFGDNKDFWIGITDIGVEGFWMTDDYHYITYAHWDVSYPNGGYAAGCAYYAAAQAAWRDGSCFSQHAIICERSSPEL
ncbi:MAG TPA: C-type lectin domain-containing protein, partial [Polyangiaceae bacterium]|nr:C-type lectin domain-containing protein [Polyangiaceae bacterium]